MGDRKRDEITYKKLKEMPLSFIEEITSSRTASRKQKDSSDVKIRRLECDYLHHENTTNKMTKTVDLNFHKSEYIHSSGFQIVPLLRKLHLIKCTQNNFKM